MVLLKKLYNISKIGKRNDDVLVPLLNDSMADLRFAPSKNPSSDLSGRGSFIRSKSLHLDTKRHTLITKRSKSYCLLRQSIGGTTASKGGMAMASEVIAAGTNLHYSSVRSVSSIFEKLCGKIETLMDSKLEQIRRIMKNYGEVSLGDVTVACVFSGLKDVIGMVTETSELDPSSGIRIRSYTIDDLLKKLPSKEPGSDCPYTEAVLWLLLTNEIPTVEETLELAKELNSRSTVPKHVFKVIDAYPVEAHPMTQFIAAVTALQTESVFRRAYFEKTYNKDTCWKLILHDTLDLIAKNVVIVGYIYRRSILKTNVTHDLSVDHKLDYGANLARFFGNDDKLFSNTMRLYLALHSDHEGGNVSAHASHLVGSSLADPYFCLSSALCGLSGPLHGMANQECLTWLLNLKEQLKGQEITPKNVKKFAEDTLARKQVIPGYGHAVLRVTDPRHTAFFNFIQANIPDEPLIKLLKTCLQVIPEVLKSTGKVRNPNPNVDCSTGVLLSSIGVHSPEIFTVLFGLSRAFGILSQLVWARALRYPIERPKSLTLDSIEEICESLSK